jgi:hypothetical protein
MCGDEEKQVAAYGRYVIPHFNGKKRSFVAMAARKNGSIARRSRLPPPSARPPNRV